ncbi:hypothetical protein [Nodosilinea nodulosa]|uniref:hypothetical protein n=1 Tax=Nodosilinea nodulosa TaxID=416001 RepID=UPI000373A59D|nr:hypothetical protein [Nodosilinea nodulosa]
MGYISMNPEVNVKMLEELRQMYAKAMAVLSEIAGGAPNPQQLAGQTLNNITANEKPFSLDNVVEALVYNIQTYESDTFSGSGFEVTQDEARTIAAKLISKFLIAPDGMPGDYIDGLELNDQLHQVRFADKENHDSI